MRTRSVSALHAVQAAASSGRYALPAAADGARRSAKRGAAACASCANTRGTLPAAPASVADFRKERRFMIRSSAARWEDALQGDAEVEGEEGHHVVVRL